LAEQDLTVVAGNVVIDMPSLDDIEGGHVDNAMKMASEAFSGPDLCLLENAFRLAVRGGGRIP
jgi:hypothetical protein